MTANRNRLFTPISNTTPLSPTFLQSQPWLSVVDLVEALVVVAQV
jgi:hypothetical protein